MPTSKARIESYVSPDELRAVILDFERYPEFLEEVKRVEVEARDERSARVAFGVEVRFGGFEVKTDYVLRYQIDEKTIAWTLHASRDLTENKGAWTLALAPDGEGTVAHYEAEVVTNLPVPPNVQALFAEQTLPKLMEKFRDRAESL